MKTYTILCKATYVSLYEVYYQDEGAIDSVPVLEDHLCLISVQGITYMEAVASLMKEGITDTIYDVEDIGAIAGTRRVAPYANDICWKTSVEQVYKVIGYVDPLEEFTLQDTQPIIPVVCGYDIER